MLTTELMQAVEVVNGSFTPSDVSDIVLKYIDQQINFYKLKRLSRWIKDHNADQQWYDEKIHQLRRSKREIESMIEEARAEGLKIQLEGNFQIHFAN